MPPVPSTYALTRAPDQMTTRARWYLSIGAVRHLLIGGFAFFFPDMFTSPLFLPVTTYLPLSLWGSAFVVAGILCIVSTFINSVDIARVGLIISAASTAAWGAGVLIGFVSIVQSGGVATPIVAILMLALAFKDLAVCTQPMCSPFESLLREKTPNLFICKRRAAPTEQEQEWRRPPSGD